jgi:hypothetical protein
MGKFKIGDKVRIINYGHRIYDIKNGKLCNPIDINPDIIGKKGVIVEKHGKQYAIHGIKTKYAWYDKEQLEAI